MQKTGTSCCYLCPSQLMLFKCQFHNDQCQNLKKYDDIPFHRELHIYCKCLWGLIDIIHIDHLVSNLKHKRSTIWRPRWNPSATKFGRFAVNRSNNHSKWQKQKRFHLKCLTVPKHSCCLFETSFYFVLWLLCGKCVPILMLFSVLIPCVNQMSNTNRDWPESQNVPWLCSQSKALNFVLGGKANERW